MRGLKKSVALVMLVMMTALFSVSVTAAGSNVTYSGNAGTFIFAPGSKYSPTDLFTNFKDVMPGDSRTQTITVENLADRNVKVNIYLRSHGATDEKYVAFLDQLRLTVQKAEETPMFDAAADETAGLSDWVLLGTLYSGGTVDLHVTLEAPVTMDDRFQKNYGEIEWEFGVEELPVSPEDPKPPKTGDDANLGLWIGIMTLCGAGALFVMRRKGEKRAEA